MVLEKAGRASMLFEGFEFKWDMEAAGRSLEPAGRALEPAGKASELAGKTPEQAERPRAS